jgi:hypothetical protein
VTETARKSSCSISCSQASPEGGVWAFVGRQRAMKGFQAVEKLATFRANPGANWGIKFKECLCIPSSLS